MKYLPLVVLCLILFAGCTSTIVSSDINPTEVYKGYPCFGNCEAFKTGYESADKQALETMESCSNFPSNELLGCEARVQEFIIKKREDNWMDAVK
jgi:hypothetical protein